MTAPCPTFGFEVVFEPRPGLSDQSLRTFHIQWTAYLDGHGLCIERASAPAGGRFVVLGEGTQATDADRSATAQWLAGRPELAHWSVGDLADWSRHGN